MKKIVALVIVVCLAAIAFYRADIFTPRGKIIKRTRFMMDTLCTIQVPNELGARKTEAAMERAFDRMSEVDRKFNVLNQDSPAYKFNNGRQPISDPEIYALVKTGLEISRETGGAFDMTAYPLTDLWGFYKSEVSTRTVPSGAAVRQVLAKVGWRRLLLKDGTVFPADKDVKIDLGGIAKGYAIAEAVKVLKASGIKSALIIAGGQVQVFGSAAEGKPWKVGVRNPRHDGYMAGLEFTEETGISTSGDYERFFEADGVRYHHIIDPGTGYPARGLMSASVITPDPVQADALSTALFVMGRDRALALAKKRRDLEILIVDDKGKIFNSREIPEGSGR
jgi:thiamine biosynthesis lipoprotein